MRSEGSSSDRYVRIPTTALFSVQLQHLVSQKDDSIAAGPEGGASGAAAAALTGITEWVGSWHNQGVTVGWDWGVINGVIVLLSQNEIRTNIQLIAPDRSPVPSGLAQIHLFHWVETLPWRELAIEDLIRGTR